MGILGGIGLIIRVIIGLAFVIGGAFLIYCEFGLAGSILCGIITFPWLWIFGAESLEAFFAVDSNVIITFVLGGIAIPIMLYCFDANGIANVLAGGSTMVYGVMFSGLLDEEAMTALVSLASDLGLLALAPIAILIIFVILFFSRFG